MNEITWSKEELQAFERLVNEASSSNQFTRSCGRFAMCYFIDRHGKKKCDAMWAHIEGKSVKKEKAE